MPEKEKIELEIRRALSQLRHLYWNMVNGSVRPKQEDIARIAEGILSPEIKRLEKLADSLIEKK